MKNSNPLQSLTVLCLMVAIGCTDSTPEQQSQSSVAASSTQDDSTEAATLPKYTIVAGKGTEGIQLGEDRQCAIDVLGEPSSNSAGYLEFLDAGVDIAYIKSGQIRTAFFYYRSPEHGAFDGQTARGIGRDSSVEDVLELYGKPSRVGESTISEFGAKPGAREKSLDYSELGITFTFWDDELADIRVYE
ncbi:MAG: hypothetical protein AAFX06_20775 [Planctomycetota bacterium]